MIGAIDGQVRKRQVEYEEHHLQQLRCKGDSTIGSDKFSSLTTCAYGSRCGPGTRQVPWKSNSESMGLRRVRPSRGLRWTRWLMDRQDSFMENFLQNQRGDVFTGVALLIYVFDIESRDFPRDLETFTTVLEALYDGSPDARLFCLFHKMDLVQEELREELFMEREAILRQISHMFTDVAVLGTSIWDETLYKVLILI